MKHPDQIRNLSQPKEPGRAGSSCMFYHFGTLRRWTSSHSQYCIKREKECMKRVAGLGKMPIKEIA